MAGGLIGSLRVALGLDSAQFTTGIKKAQGDLKIFGAQVTVSVESIVGVVGRLGRALPDVVKRTLDHADAMGKAAQKAGVSVQALSRLEYAARLSDVSMEGLTGSLTKLGKAMVDATTDKTGAASIAFKALGIDVRDASGNIRDSNAVFLDIADRFGRMEDGATKSTLAMQLFGKAGAELIPLLNSGRDGLKGMADESDRVGFTLTTRTTDAAQAFNDTLTRLQLATDGVVNKIMVAALPALQGLADIMSSQSFATAAGTMANNIITAINQIVVAAAAAMNAISDLKTTLNPSQDTILQRIADANGMKYDPGSSNIENRTTPGWLDQSRRDNSWKGAWGSIKPAAASPATTPLIDLAALGDAAKSANQFIDPFQARMQELAPVLDDLHNPMSTMKDDLTDLETMYKNGRITAEAYGQAVTRTYANVAASAFDMASGITGALASMFKDNKAFAVANAVVQTLSGVANAIGSGPPPWNFINAGIVAATGAANVANILSTSETSTSVPGNSAASAASGSGSAATPRQAVNISLQGGQLFSSDMVEQLLNQMADAMGDGAGSRLINVVRA